MSKFYEYFKENMDAMHLDVPETLFGKAGIAVGTAKTLLEYVDKFGTKVTVREVVLAGTRLEKLAVVGAASVAYYTGAVIGSLAVATGRTLAGGTSLADVLSMARTHNLDRDWLGACLIKFPGIYQVDLQGRCHYRNAMAFA